MSEQMDYTKYVRGDGSVFYLCAYCEYPAFASNKEANMQQHINQKHDGHYIIVEKMKFTVEYGT